MLLKLAHHVGNRGLLLSNRHIDTFNASTLLVDDGIDGNRGLARLTVADNQLALATADRNHGVDRFQSSLQRLAHRLAGDNTRSNLFDGRTSGFRDRPLAIDGPTQGIHNTPQEPFTHWHFKDAPGTANRIPLSEMLVSTQNNGAHRVPFQVKGHTIGIPRKLHHFPLHDIGQAMNPHDTIGQTHDRSLAARLYTEIEVFDPGFYEFTDFRWIQLHNSFLALIPETFRQSLDLAADGGINHSIPCPNVNPTNQVPIDFAREARLATQYAIQAR